MDTKINQKEYLKRYLMGSDNSETKSNKKKKKIDKEKSSKKVTSVKIIDDDVDLSMLQNTLDDDIERFNINEDAPQIVGVVDDRPPELIAREDYKKSIKWRTLGTGAMTSDENKTAAQGASLARNASPKRNGSVDLSPVRKREKTNDKHDVPPPRKSRFGQDESPPRRRKRDSPDASSRRRSESNKSPHRDESPRSKKRHSNSPDLSPRRRQQSPGQKSKIEYRQIEKNRDASSPSRRQRDNYSSDESPKRRDRSSTHHTRRSRSRDASPRQSQSNRHQKRQKSESPPPTHKKMVKTLDGKIAGLQNASALRTESEKFKRREDELYKQMTINQPDEMEARVRKTGRRRDMEQDSAKEMDKMRVAEERKAVYDRWGKGLKQIEHMQERFADEQHEQSKPLARYANDGDLDIHLKQQHRDGDPMAAYIQSKAKEKGFVSSKPKYNGAFDENRFNIRPGYRWDGVNRSNGYEKKWFQVQSQKKATEEEAYKYSVEDM